MRDYHQRSAAQVAAARERQAARRVAASLGGSSPARAEVEALAAQAEGRLEADSIRALDGWPSTVASYQDEARDDLYRESLSGTRVPRVALPRFNDEGELLRWLRSENLPGRFPYSAGVFAFKRQGEDPARMFAGEGDAARTNRRFKLLAQGQPATRLSTAFDSVTLYGSSYVKSVREVSKICG